MYEMLTYTECA